MRCRLDNSKCLVCDTFLEAKAVLETQAVAALLPSFFVAEKTARAFFRVHIPGMETRIFNFHLAWNPRLLRLNPPAVRKRDWLADTLAKQMVQ